MVAMVDGTQWIGLDPATGQRRGQPIDLGFVPVRSVQHVDLDGDGEPEILALGPGRAGEKHALVAFAPGTGRELWVAPIAVGYEPGLNGSTPDWPLVVDLDGDGRSEVAVPDSGPMAPGAGYRGVQLIDGSSGRTRWIRPMRPETRGGDGLHPGPRRASHDLDHDGVRDLVTTSFFLGRSVISNHEGEAADSNT